MDESTRGAAVVVGVGASRGLGAALCRRFAREGLHVVPVGRSAERLAAVAEEIASGGGQATPQAADATDPEAVEAAFATAEREAGSLALVVYNAGNMRTGTVAELDAAAFESTWRVTCLGGFLVGQAAARRMAARGSGTLIFTGATASLRARPPFTAFASAKAALRAVAFGMARELGPQGVHVAHVVVDGVIRGDQALSRMPELEERLGTDGLLAPEAIADTYWSLHVQDRTAWTLELDLRPYRERF